MKKITLPLCLFAALSLNAQRLSIDFSSGFSNGIAGVSTYGESETLENGVYIEKETYLPINFSSGWVARLGLTAQLTDQVFFTVATRYRKSGEKEYEFFKGYYTDGTNTLEETESVFINHSNLEVQLGLGLHRNISDRLSLSMSAGPSFGVFSSMTERYFEFYKENYPPNTYEETDEQTREYKPFFQVGAYTDVALNYQLSSKISIFGNATLRLQTWSPKSSQVISSKDNGVEEVNQLTTYQTETEYSDNVAWNQGPPNQNEPRKDTKQWSPGSSLELTLGLRYSFGSAPKAALPSTGKKGISFSLLGGYGLGIGGESVTSGDQNSLSSKQYSYGSGMHFGLMADYSFLNGVSVELGASYNKSEIEREFNINSSTKYTDIGTMMRIKTGIKLESDAKRLNPFVRAGLSTGVGSKIVMQSETPSTVRESEFTGNLSFGCYGGLGVSFKLSPSISLIGQATTFVQAWTPSYYKKTKHTYNGVDQLANESTMNKEFDLVDEVVYNSNDPQPDENKPGQEVKMKTPFSAAVFSLGVRISLTK